MEAIHIFRLEHRGSIQIGLSFAFDNEVKQFIQNLPKTMWSQTHNCYYQIYTEENLNDLRQQLDDHKMTYTSEEFKKKKTIYPEINVEHRKLLWQYVRYLRGLRLSENTVRCYYFFVLQFLKNTRKELSEINNRDVEIFMENQTHSHAFSISSHRQCISAIKHFAELFMDCDIDVSRLRRPKKSQFLPVVLSQRELINLLIATRNLKHRAALALMYSCGLRVGELVALKLADIDMDRRQIHVKQSKGRKDRYIGMAENMIPLLHNYLGSYKPNNYFLNGQNGEMYSTSAIRNFLKQNVKKAEIIKKVTPHTLRHSYATHLLESGTGLRYIQELLGHAKPETTMIYTHVAQKDLMHIINPLDTAIESMRLAKEDKNLRLSRE